MSSSNQAEGRRQRSTEPRRKPTQQRARRRRRDILVATVELLEEVGVDGLTTILIAKRLNISVGSLYHYFPNKQAILYALGAHWLDQMTHSLELLEAKDLESMGVAAFVEAAVDQMHAVYREQQALLPLMQALWSIPELRQLDAEHDEIYISKMSAMMNRLCPGHPEIERNRVGRVYLSLTHGVLLAAIRQPDEIAARTLADLKRLAGNLLEPRCRAADGIPEDKVSKTP